MAARHGTCALPWLLLPLLLSAPARAADVCSDEELEGPYGFLLSGRTTISGSETPVVSLGRIVLDDEGIVSGSSSVHFNGLLLGNPVTGAYEVNSDCSMTMSLQDTSGAFQHFGGKVTPGGDKVTLYQTDPGAGARGLMEKTSDACDLSNVRPQYAFTLSGAFTALATGGASGPIAAGGSIHADANSHFTFTQKLGQGAVSNEITGDVTFEIATDCIVQMAFTLKAEDGQTDVPIKLRAVLVNEGKEILAIQTEPSLTASARFTAP